MTVARVGVRAEPATQLGAPSLTAMLQRLAPLFVAVVVFGVAAWAVAPYPVGIFHDDGVYLILAKALASGNGYRYLHLPGTPLATHYPPAYPALLALLWKIAPNFPGNLSLFLLVNAALLASAAWALQRFARVHLEWPQWLAVTVALVGTLSLPLLLLSTLVMSEVLCIAIAIPLLAASEGALGDDESRPVRDVSLGAAAGVLALVRMHALALALAVVLLLLKRGKWARAGWFTLGAVVMLAPWQLWVRAHDAALTGALHGSYGSYAGWFAQGIAHGGAPFVWHTLATNLTEVAALLADRIAPWPPGWMRILPLVIGLALLGAGAVRLRRRAPVTLVFLAIYFAATLLWPYAPWRFVWAIWPLVLVVFVEGALAGVEAAPLDRTMPWRMAAVAAPALLAVGILHAEIESYRARAWRAPVQSAQRQIAPVVRWAAMRTAPEDLLLADDEPLVYLMTGRLALPPASFTALEYVHPAAPTDSIGVRTLRGLLERYPVRYVLTVVPQTRDAARQLAHSAAGSPSLHELEDLGPAGAVFEVIR